MKKLLVVFLLILTNSIEGQITTDRPLYTKDANIVSKANFQLEYGLGGSFSGETEFKNGHIISNLGTARIGLTNMVEFQVSGSSQASKWYESKRNTPFNLGLGIKISLRKKEGSAMRIALLSKFNFDPLHLDYEFSSGVFQNRLCFSHSLSNTLVLSYNVRHYLFLYGGAQSFGLSIALDYRLNDNVSIFTEGYSAIEDFITRNVTMAGGLKYSFSTKCQIDLSYRTGYYYFPNHVEIGVSAMLSKSSI